MPGKYHVQESVNGVTGTHVRDRNECTRQSSNRSARGVCIAGEHQLGSPRRRVSVNSACVSSSAVCLDTIPQMCPLYDVNVATIDDKFTSAIYNVNTQVCEESKTSQLQFVSKMANTIPISIWLYSPGRSNNAWH